MRVTKDIYICGDEMRKIITKMREEI